jgi:hypothetical protein
VGDLIQRNLEHFCWSVVDPRNTAVIESDMSVRVLGLPGQLELLQSGAF